jgi:hypothetical protein
MLDLPPAPPMRAIATGDRVRWRSDGRLEFMGRGDNELKISGMRVEPAEIEAVLSAMPHVGQAAVAGVTGADGVTRLWAWFTSASPAPPTSVELRAGLAESLPEHMIPESFRLLEALPMTPSGKLDRRSLAAQALEAPLAAMQADRAAASHAERIVQAAFAEVLAKPVGVTENFFAAGGHSLLAARALARINSRLGASLRIRDFFGNPTAARLAQVAERDDTGVAPAAIPRLARSARPAESLSK